MSGVASGFSKAAARTWGANDTHAVPWVRDDRHAWLVGAVIWVLIVLMIVPDRLDYADMLHETMPTSGSLSSRLAWLALLGVGGIVVCWRASFAWLLLRALNPWLLVFVALAGASLLWSIRPDVTLRRMIRVVTMVLDCLALVLIAWHPRRFQNVMRPILTIMLAGSIAFGILCPTLAIHQSTSPELLHAWHGLAMQKNGLGALACMGLVFWVHAWLAEEVRPAVAATGAALALACMLLSRSSTALVCGIFVTGFMLLLLRSPPNLRRFMPRIVSAFVVLLLVYSVAILRLFPSLDVLLTPVTLITGKDLSFTGRSDIWAIITAHIGLHPLLGTGYGAYWTGPVPGSPSYVFVERMYFYPASSHNGYLEIVNDLGAAGLVCLLGYLATQVRHALQLMQFDRTQAALYLAIFLEQAINNLSETHWLSWQSVDFVIMTLATTALARSRLDWQLRRYFGDPFAMALPDPPPGVAT